MGCLWAAQLRAAGERVVLLGRNDCQDDFTLSYKLVDSLRSSLPAAAPASMQFQLRCTNAASLYDSGERINKLLVCTKAYDAVQALDSVLGLVSNDASIVTLCNGLGFQEVYSRKLMALHNGIDYLAAVSSEGALLRAPGSVLHTGRGVTRIGAYRRIPGSVQAGIAKNDAGKNIFPREMHLVVEWVSDIARAVLQKAMVNCAINPLTALYRCRNGELLDNYAYHVRFAALCEELQGIYRALRASGEYGEYSENGEHFDVLASATEVARATAQNSSSMLQDLLLGRRLELAALNGFVVDKAEKMALQCAINRQLVDSLRRRA